MFLRRIVNNLQNRKVFDTNISSSNSLGTLIPILREVREMYFFKDYLLLNRPIKDMFKLKDKSKNRGLKEEYRKFFVSAYIPLIGSGYFSYVYEHIREQCSWQHNVIWRGFYLNFVIKSSYVSRCHLLCYTEFPILHKRRHFFKNSKTRKKKCEIYFDIDRVTTIILVKRFVDLTLIMMSTSWKSRRIILQMSS